MLDLRPFIYLFIYLFITIDFDEVFLTKLIYCYSLSLMEMF